MFWNKNKKDPESEKSFYSNLNPYAAKSARPQSSLAKRLTTKLRKSNPPSDEAPLAEPSPVLQPGDADVSDQPVALNPDEESLLSSEEMTEDSLPGVLVMQGVASPAQMDEALRRQQENGVFFGDALADMGAVTATHLVGFLSKYCQIPHLSLLDYVVDKDTANLLPAEVCWKYYVLAIDKMGRNLTVAMVNPLNEEARAEIARQCPTLRVKPILCSHKDFETVAARIFGPRQDKSDKHWTRVSQNMMPTSTGGAPEKADTSPSPADPRPVIPAAPVIPAQAQAPEMHSSELNFSINDSFVDHVFFDVDNQVGQALSEFKSTPVTSKFKLSNTQDRADEIVKSFSSEQDLVSQYTEMMMESMRNSYELLARKIPFFHGIEARDVTKFFSHGQVKVYEFGQIVYEKGEFSNEMYIILNGCVELHAPGAEPIVLRRGDIFGETALRGGEVRSESARVIAHSSIMKVDFKSLTESLSQSVSTQLLANIVVILGQRLERVRRRQEITQYHWLDETASKNSAAPSDEVD